MMIAIILWLYMQDFYRSEEAYEARANEQAHQACYKLVKDMHYEARVQAVVVYCAEFEKRRSRNQPQGTSSSRETST